MTYRQAHPALRKSIANRLDRLGLLLARSIVLVAVIYFGMHVLAMLGRTHMQEILLVSTIFAGIMVLTALVDLLTRGPRR